ncbi:hypothetical protein Pmar_PMAR018457 [Perkinsus marinus ATCC 50983]|uniref:Uncharacterized protein n=1 Tax=Perkinsus marinus (strain ATCC 50983 / TXsc) TaxID=423536 RepID=C5KZV8_PERM5|nr:hypothetical protein Pmar_PMAR018457 [Perkinsus marinus ATCC 50983]EER09816.1 hypothetical protein Pmar_PMAR018457 [Perkinsus marinus ATCC 50983]|eukprot:XP_002778021.1 hypothetical protein Pmar_PMAR018457 [Perkinsus marinus ATCC 50983]
MRWSTAASATCTLLMFGMQGCSTAGGSKGSGNLPSALPDDPNQPVTFPASTPFPPTARPISSDACSGNKIGTYTWSQSYWRESDDSLINFATSDMGRQWNCGDLYINIADASNYNIIKDQTKLVSWMKKWRQETGNNGVIWLTYGDVVDKNGEKMVGFVTTFEQFLMRSVSAQTMAEIAPIGISFDVEHIADNYYKEALTKSHDMINEVTQGMGYLPNSIYVDSTIEGEENSQETEYVMRYADHALMMLYRNELGGSYEDDLLERMKWMMTEQCTVCTKPGWEDLKAKITIMVEGSCKMGHGCGKLSMCAKDTSSYPDANGGIEYIWNTLNNLTKRMVEEGVVTQEQFDHLFDVNGTLFAVHNWEWSRCFYGDSYSQDMGFSVCKDYHSMAADCRLK